MGEGRDQLVSGLQNTEYKPYGWLSESKPP